MLTSVRQCWSIFRSESILSAVSEVVLALGGGELIDRLADDAPEVVDVLAAALCSRVLSLEKAFSG